MHEMQAQPLARSLGAGAALRGLLLCHFVVAPGKATEAASFWGPLAKRMSADLAHSVSAAVFLVGLANLKLSDDGMYLGSVRTD